MTKVTLEKLARMVNDGFERIDGRFEKMDRKIDGFGKKLKELKEDIENWRITVDDHETRIGRLEKKTGMT